MNDNKRKREFLYNRILAQQFKEVMEEKKGDWTTTDPIQVLLLEILKEEQFRNDKGFRTV